MRLLLTLLSLLTTAAPAVADDVWSPVREVSLELGPGSPLDFSGFLANPPIEDASRIVINGDGRLARANALEKPVRFLCASLGWSPASGGFPDHDGADRYARQLRMHGYNIARFHFVDAALMFGRSRDFDFDTEVMDRFHYLMAALKRNGIYWIMDGLTSSRGAYGGYEDRWEFNSDLKLTVQIEEDAFQHWLRFQEKVLATVNPYTGIAPIRDPALALIIPFNENSIEFDSILHERDGTPHYSDKLRPAFNDWLKKRYGSTDKLADAWGWVQRGERIEDGTVGLPANRYEKSPRMRDLQAFFVDVETRSAERMTQALRKLGYTGIVSPYNNWPSIQTSLSRAGQQAVAMNTYQDWVGSYEPGSSIQQKSSIADGAAYMRVIAAARWLGRPFFVTEYDHLFWSRYRYEAGIVMPAYGALQNWDVLCRHAHGPIILAYGEDFAHKRQMLPYAIALDPVARAGETLAALLFRRGDVRGSPVSIPFLIKGEEDLTQSVEARERDDLTSLALLSAIGLSRPDDNHLAGKQDLTIPSPRRNASADAIIAALRDRDILDYDNETDVADGVYVSDTDEIRLDRDKLRISVTTGQTEAIAFADLPGSIRLKSLTAAGASGSGMFAVSSLDGLPVAASRRLLVIFATDARNSGMRFADAEERVIADFGHLPVLIKVGSIAFTLPGKGNWRLSPVGLDGRVHPPVASGQGDISTRLSNDAPDGPTTYFLIERD
ncbi:glycoside hydrolase [Phyllobacterium phragmitis]|uniref:Glycoside hydrolase n=1 Tax=Phyllobacterium phragmitis TaxID=2670329 RepID=A0A2S9IUV0_9HYPH|nr:beta-galactosidase [Phyllobacterium phragmitis]PRD44309.1 glycoside hydrolase [Phyllobacterium phragmitis]